jgi:hypothetical protein
MRDDGPQVFRQHGTQEVEDAKGCGGVSAEALLARWHRVPAEAQVTFYELLGLYLGTRGGGKAPVSHALRDVTLPSGVSGGLGGGW